MGVLLAALAASTASAACAVAVGDPVASVAPTPAPPLPPRAPVAVASPAAATTGWRGVRSWVARQYQEAHYNEQAAVYERDRQRYCAQFPQNQICSAPPLQPMAVPGALPPPAGDGGGGWVGSGGGGAAGVPDFFTAPPQPEEVAATDPMAPRFFSPPPGSPYRLVPPQPRQADDPALVTDEPVVYADGGGEESQQMALSASPQPLGSPSPPATLAPGPPLLPSASPPSALWATPAPPLAGGAGSGSAGGTPRPTAADGAPQPLPQQVAAATEDTALLPGPVAEVVASSEVCLLKDEWEDYLQANEKALKQYEMPDKARTSFTQAIKELPTKVGKYHCFRDQAEFDYMGELVANAFSTASSAQMTERIGLLPSHGRNGGARRGAMHAAKKETCAVRAAQCNASWRYGCTSRKLCCCPSFCVGYFDTVFSTLRIAQSTRKRSTNSCCQSCFC